MKLRALFSQLDPGLPLFYLRRRRYHRLQEREEKGHVSQWFLLCGRAPKDFLLHPQPAGLRKILPPPDRLWADPFLRKTSDGYCVFFEEWFFGESRGHICAMDLSPEGEPISAAQPVVKEPHHLSYPFLFEYENSLFMLPESGGGGAIDLYECVDFPAGWHKKTVLMQRLRHADPTLFHHDGKWWLFATVRAGLHGVTRDLFLFWADHPLSGRWEPHPLNPVVRDERSARPAGPLFEINGRLFRPSQNSLVRYGHKRRINEILELDTRHYRERLVHEVEPGWDQGVRSNHHIHWCEGLVVMDAQRLLPESEAIVKPRSA